MFIITMQYVLGIPPILRTNVDYVFILRENIIQNRKKLYDAYAGMFPSLDIFHQVMDACTENFECLVVNNNAKSNKLVDQVFWYKAKEHKNFQIGSKCFWQHHNTHCKDESSDSDDQIKSSYNRKKRNRFVNFYKNY